MQPYPASKPAERPALERPDAFVATTQPRRSWSQWTLEGTAVANLRVGNVLSDRESGHAWGRVVGIRAMHAEWGHEADVFELAPGMDGRITVAAFERLGSRGRPGCGSIRANSPPASRSEPRRCIGWCTRS